MGQNNDENRAFPTDEYIDSEIADYIMSPTRYDDNGNEGNENGIYFDESIYYLDDGTNSAAIHEVADPAESTISGPDAVGDSCDDCVTSLPVEEVGGSSVTPSSGSPTSTPPSTPEKKKRKKKKKKKATPAPDRARWMSIFPDAIPVEKYSTTTTTTTSSESEEQSEEKKKDLEPRKLGTSGLEISGLGTSGEGVHVRRLTRPEPDVKHHYPITLPPGSTGLIHHSPQLLAGAPHVVTTPQLAPPPGLPPLALAPPADIVIADTTSRAAVGGKRSVVQCMWYNVVTHDCTNGTLVHRQYLMQSRLVQPPPTTTPPTPAPPSYYYMYPPPQPNAHALPVVPMATPYAPPPPGSSGYRMAHIAPKLITHKAK